MVLNLAAAFLHQLLKLQRVQQRGAGKGALQQSPAQLSTAAVAASPLHPDADPGWTHPPLPSIVLGLLINNVIPL